MNLSGAPLQAPWLLRGPAGTEKLSWGLRALHGAASATQAISSLLAFGPQDV